MAINPMAMMKMKERLDIFNSQHPRVVPFLQAAKVSLQEGAVLELKVTGPDGKELLTNIRVTAEDMETIRMMQETRS